MKIEVNIGKRHFWAMMAMAVLLFGVTMVIAKTPPLAFTADQPFHETLFVDTVAGKSGGTVTVDDDLVVTGMVSGDGSGLTDITFAHEDCYEITYIATGRVMCDPDYYVAGIHDDGVGMPGPNGLVCCKQST